MNERATTSNHDNETIYDRPPRFERLPDGLQLESLDQIVVLGEQARREYAQDSAIAESLDVYIDTKVAEALRDRGLDAESDDPEVQRDYQAAKATYDGVARTKEVDWLASPVGDPEGAPVRNQVINMLLDRYSATTHEAGTIAGADDVADIIEGEREQEFSLQENRTLLDQRRTSLAELSAKRQGRIAGKGGEAYAEAKELYDEQMILLAKAELRSELEDDSVSDDAKKIRVTEYLLEEQTKLRELTIDKLQNTPVGNFVKYMNRGKIATRIAKGLGLGLVAGAVGAGIGVIAGVAGVTAVGAGVATAATAAVRFARGFARVDAREGRGMQQLSGDQAQKDEIVNQLNTESSYIDTVHQQLSDKYEEDTKKEQGKRRKSVGAGVLGIVLGAGIAAGAHALIDAGAFDGFGNRNLNAPSGASPAPVETPPGDTNGGGENIPHNDDHIGQPHDTQKEAEDLAKKNAIPSSDTPDVADAINKALGGEGTGVSDGHWAPGGIEGYLNGDLGTTELTQAGLENFEAWANNYTVQPGDTIWGLSEKYLQAQGITNPSVYQIDAVKDAALADFQARGIVGVNGWLSAGQSLHVK